jgi:hypothetical protein
MGQSQNPVSPLSQPLNVGVATTSNANGACTFTFQSPPAGMTWSGTLNVKGAPASAIFTVMISGTGWGTFGGASVFGPVQINGQGSEQLVVTATGLDPTTAYEAYLIGSSDATTYVASLWPDSTSQLTTSISTSGYQFAGVSSFPYLAGVTVYNDSFTANGFYAGFMLQVTSLTALGTPTGTGLTLGLKNFTTGQISSVSFGYSDPNFPAVGSVLYIPMIVAPGDKLFVYGGVIGYSGTPFVDGYSYAANVWGISTAPSTFVQSNPGTTVDVSTSTGMSLDVVQYGGLQKTASINATTLGKLLLNAPAAGYANRIHSINWFNMGAGSTFDIYFNTGSLIGYQIFSVPIGAANTGVPQYMNLNGLLITEQLYWKSSVAVLNAKLVVTYDVVAYPYIS